MKRVIVLLMLALPGLAQVRVVVTNSANFEAGRAVAPNSLASAFGEFAGVTEESATSLPLPANLGGVELLVGGEPAPLRYVSSTQINFLVPQSAAIDPRGINEPVASPVTVRLGGEVIGKGTLAVRQASPAVFVLNVDDPARPAAVINENRMLNGPSARADRGSVIEIFATGRGGTRGVTESAPAVFFALEPAEVLSSNVPEGLPGVWMLRVRIPGAPSVAGQVPFVVLHRGVQSNVGSVWLAD